MKKIVIFVLSAIMVMGLAISAQAVPTINDPWDPVSGPEKNLYQIFADPLFNGGVFATSQDIANTVPIVETLPPGLQDITVSAYAKFAAFNQNPGFYPQADPTVHQYFSSFSTDFPPTNNGILTVTDWPDVISTIPFGFFNDTASGGDIKFTELALNSGGFTQSNGLIFQVSPFHWIVAFEDGAGANSLGDKDYNDLVLNVTAARVVPLPPGVFLLGSGLLCLVAMRRRLFG